jgi:hypothetical protein
MGEAKRRKQNDSNYGQPTILTLNPTDTNKFLTGLLDLTVVEAEDVLPTLAPGTEESVKELDEALKQHQSKMQVVLPIEHTENPARDYLVKNWSLAWDSLSKLRAKHGKGIIYQEAQLDKDMTQFNFFPASEEILRSLETEIFTRSLGKTMGSLFRTTVRYLDWSKYIPVLAMTTRNGDGESVWFYIIESGN